MYNNAIKPALIVLTLLVFCTTTAIASAGEDFVGSWEGYDYESAEVFRIDFFEDSMFNLEFWNFEEGFYVIDEANGEIGFSELDGEDADFEWMNYAVDDEIMWLESDGELMEFAMMWCPFEQAHVLDATWMLLVSEEELESEEEIDIIYITFNADGTAIYEELDEVIFGMFVTDPKNETIELFMDEDGEEHIETGHYQFDEEGMLTITIGGDPISFHRLF